MLQHKEDRLTQLFQEVVNLALRYGEVDWDEREGRWVFIAKLPLPPQYAKPYTACYLVIPANYPEIPPDGSYVDPDLGITNSHVGNGKPMYKDMSLAWICAHLKGWRPKQPWTQGNNLITVIEAVMYQLNQLKKVKR